MTEFRPVLYRAAAALRAPGDARELADSVYGDLFGVQAREGQRRSLLRYYHGRASLATWLRSVLAQRAVDLARAASRTTSLDAPAREDAPPTDLPAPARGPDDPHRSRYLLLVRAAFAAALAALSGRDRLRLSLYYARGLRLAAIGKVLGESEATASRKLDRTRRELRQAIAADLRVRHGFDPAQVAQAFEYAAADEAFDLERALPTGEGSGQMAMDGGQ